MNSDLSGSKKTKSQNAVSRSDPLQGSDKNVFCNYLCFGWQPALGGEYKENNASVLFPNNIYGKVLVKEE